MTNNIRSNVIVNLVRTLVLTFLSFITFPWACRYLGETSIGVYNWALTFVSFFLILAKVGLPNLAIRECVKVRDNKQLLSNKVQGFFLIQLITTVMSFGLMCIPVFAVPALKENSSVIFILSINFLTGVFSFEWVFIALEKQYYMSIRTIIILCISSILTVGFITNPDDIYIYSLITISVTVLTSLVNIFVIKKYVSFKKTAPYNLKQYARPLFVMCSISLSLSLYNQIDTFILGFLDPTKVEVASYSVGIKGIDIILGFMTALTTVFVPRAEYCYEKEDKTYFNNINKYSMNICLFIVIPAIATMTILSKPVCGIVAGVDYSLGDAFKNAPYVLVILAGMMITYAISEMIYGQILLPQKKEKIYLFSILGGCILNIILSILFGTTLYKGNPSLGVALSTILSDIAVLIVLVACTWKWTKNAFFTKNTLKLFLVGAIVAGETFGLLKLTNYLFSFTNLNVFIIYTLQIIIVIALCGITYVGALTLLKENLVYSFIRNFKKRRNQNA